MKTILSAAIAGVILFAISASVSWYLIKEKPVEEEHKDEVAHAEETTPEDEAGVPPIGKGIDKEAQLPVGTRPDLPLTVEAVLQLSESIRKKENELVAREKAVEKTEQNVKLLFEDLKVERAELTALLDGLEAKLKLANSTVQEVKQENESITSQAQELAKLNQSITSQKQELAKLNQQKEKKKKDKDGEEELDEIGQRVKTAKPWFEGLDDQQAADYLKEFANSGELQFAVRLLKSLPERKAAKIIGALNDAEFVQQIIQSLNEKETDDVADGKKSSLR